MLYPTLKATVRDGYIQLLGNIELPEDAVLLVTVLDESVPENLSLGEHLAAGLQDMLMGRVTEVNTPQELTHHLDTVLGET
ncbi:MAG: hypothetical protein KJ638_15480 [Chloroflexi bacterium]|nr:hypothetical protein [Chloroflexota bacterium]